MSWWKIQCLHCGINCDLLTDDWNRIICRSCLDKHEFEEVENAIQSRGRYPQGAGNSFNPTGTEREDVGDGESDSDYGPELQHEEQMDEGN